MTTTDLSKKLEVQERWIAGQNILNASTAKQLLDIGVKNAKLNKRIDVLHERYAGLLIAQLVTFLLVALLAIAFLRSH